jgi:hypothetical protein
MSSMTVRVCFLPPTPPLRTAVGDRKGDAYKAMLAEANRHHEMMSEHVARLVAEEAQEMEDLEEQARLHS